MINRLAGMRKARGISAVDLAAQVGVTRQAIYAIEAGTYMPNTAVALRLARVLDTSVEDLFALEKEETPGGGVREPSSRSMTPSPSSRANRFRSAAWAAARSESRRPLFPAWLPVADGIVSGAGARGDGRRARRRQPAPDRRMRPRAFAARPARARSGNRRHPRQRQQRPRARMASGREDRYRREPSERSDCRRPRFFRRYVCALGGRLRGARAAIRRQSAVLRIWRIRACDSSIARKGPAAGGFSIRSWKPPG